VVGITAGSREVPGRKSCDKRHPYRIIIIITIIIIIPVTAHAGQSTVHLTLYLAEFFLEWEMFQTNL